MIETLKQAQDAITEIKELTSWTPTNIARKVGVVRMTVVNVIDGKTRIPTESFMEKLDSELQRVREQHGND